MNKNSAAWYCTIKMPGLPKTYNKNRFDRKIYNTEKRLWFNRIQDFFIRNNFRIPEKPLTKCEINYTLGSARARDYDNLVSSFKVLTDSLVRHGILKDDNMQVIQKQNYAWQYAPRNEGYVQIEIREIKPVVDQELTKISSLYFEKTEK